MFCVHVFVTPELLNGCVIQGQNQEIFLEHMIGKSEKFLHSSEKYIYDQMQTILVAPMTRPLNLPMVSSITTKPAGT